VTVDGDEVVAIRPNPLQAVLWWALPTDHAFAVAGHAAVLRVTPDLQRNSYRLDLGLDGSWVDSGQSIESLPGPFGISLSPESTQPPRDALLAFALFFVGAAAIFGFAASEWGTLPPGRPYNIGGLIALAYATVGGGFLAIADGTMLGAGKRRDAVVLGIGAALGVLAALTYATPFLADPIRAVVGDSLAAVLVAVGVWLVIGSGLVSCFGALAAVWSLAQAPRRIVLARLALALFPTLGTLVALVVVRGPTGWQQAPRAEPFVWALALSIIAAGIMSFSRRRLTTTAAGA
jgi:hypothetical protein